MDDAGTTLPPEARARAVAPLIEASADRTEAGCGLPPDLLDALHEARLFRALLPRSLGGDEARPADYVRMMMVIAEADASTAWCIGQNSGCSMASAYMEPTAARRIWGDDPRAALAWGAGPQGRAIPVEGGWRVSGTWQFASGGRHATWIGAHSRLIEPDGSMKRWPNGEPIERSMLLPAAQVRLHGDWNPLGLRGTGSDSYTVDDVFVPEAHSVIRDHRPDRRESGTLYRFTTTHLYASGFGAVALGVAKGALAAFLALARDKTPQATTRMLRDSHHIQTQLALAIAKLRAAESLLLTTLDAAWSEAERGDLSVDTRMNIRLAATFATHQAREIVDFAYHEAGASAIFPQFGLERRLRDIHSVAQQVQARTQHLETVGAHLLGLNPSLRFI